MILNVQNLTKRYGENTVVDRLSLSVAEGEIFGLLGPNGAGKTTLINCIQSLLKYDSGKIEIQGKPMHPAAYDLKRQIGVVGQNVAVFDELNVYDNISFFTGLYGIKGAELKQLVEEAIEFVGLNEFRKYYPKKLSGGLLRRLNIACGIAHKPKIIFMDEPTVAVDPQSRNSILTGIEKLNANGATIVYTSHYMEEVEQICSRIAIMDMGKIIAIGTKEALKDQVAVDEKFYIEANNMPQKALEEIKRLPNVKNIGYDKKVLSLELPKEKQNLPAVFEVLKQNQVSVGRIHNDVPTLNTVFLALTGKQLRDV